MIHTEDLVRRLPTEMGGLEAGAILRTEHEYAPWEKRCHALANLLDIHKIVNTEEKRRGIEALGSEMVAKLTYYERWIVAFANILFQKQILTPGELSIRMSEIEARYSSEASTDKGVDNRRVE